MDRSVKLAYASVLIGIAVFALKYLAFLVTGSVALLSDALESVVNVATACMAVIAVTVSAKPPDTNHPFGHTKVEYLSAVVEGILIGLAALFILREAAIGLLDPRPLRAPFIGLTINMFASAINGAWAWQLIRQGRRWRSPALAADGWHLVTDVVTSAGILAGIVLVQITGWLLLDPLMAGLVAVNILWSGWRLIRESVGGLMDEAVSPALVALIRRIIAREGTGAIEAHDIRTRHAGRRTFIEFHLIVPGEMTVAEAHEICDAIERQLAVELEDSVATIHLEPDHKAKITSALRIE